MSKYFVKSATPVVMKRALMNTRMMVYYDTMSALWIFKVMWSFWNLLDVVRINGVICRKKEPFEGDDI